MKRMSMGQTVLRAILTLILFVALLMALSTFVFPNPEIRGWVQGIVASLSPSARKPIILLSLFLFAIAVVFLIFYLSGKLVSLALRITGKDPVRQYRIYNQYCREKMGDVENRLQLERPAYLSTRIRKFCVRAVLILACLLVFFLVVFRVTDTLRRVLLGIFLGLLAALGVLLAYFLLWMIAQAVSGKAVRIRRIRK